MAHQTSDELHQGFASTRWSLVLEAGRGDAPECQAALAALCQIYWYPLYAYVRRSGHAADEAKDLTQEFFARLLEKHYLRAADSERGRFRSFLLTALNRFLSKERHRARALKRGGGRRMLSLDFEAIRSRPL
jgi:DNA-directed RNA polymerase specialized sigma24 family protein